MKTVLLVGGVGAQGAVVARELASTGNYNVVIFTRDTSNKRAVALAEESNISLVANTAEHGYNFDAFLDAANKAELVYLNTDGFALGEKEEIFNGVRLFELSAKAGVKHVIYSGLDSSYRASGYDDRYYVGHYQGKSRVQDFIHAQSTKPMAWSIIRTGPYVETLSDLWAPQVADDGVYNFTYPLGDGAVPWVYLNDLGRYIDWMFSHPEESAGMDLGIAIAHTTGQQLVNTFTEVTGKPAKYNDELMDDWMKRHFGPVSDMKVGAAKGVGEASLNQTWRENFTGWFNLYKASKDNKGLIQRDYAQLDHILPDRVKSVEEWMRQSGYDGQREVFLKMRDEGRR